MRIKMLSAVLLTVLLTACTKNDEDKVACDSCTSEDGIKNQICLIGEDLYEITIGEESYTIAKSKLDESSEGLTQNEFIQKVCDGDIVIYLSPSVSRSTLERP